MRMSAVRLRTVAPPISIAYRLLLFCLQIVSIFKNGRIELPGGRLIDRVHEMPIDVHGDVDGAVAHLNLDILGPKLIDLDMLVPLRNGATPSRLGERRMGLPKTVSGPTQFVSARYFEYEGSVKR